MSYSTIYDMDGNIISDGVQSQAVCDATIQTARREAASLGRSVMVEDRGTQEVYRVTPAGNKWAAPKTWPAPSWSDDSEG